MTKFLIALIGPSGSGKTTVAESLQSTYGMESIESYTTRPMRYEGERGHTFITEEEFLKTYPEKEKSPEFVAYTEFNGYRYFATQSQVNSSEVYIIDPAGMKYLKERYKGPKKIITVWLDADELICSNRMVKRGDEVNSVSNRLWHDRRVFTDTEKAKADHVIEVTEEMSPDTIAKNILKLVAEDIRGVNIIHH